jgi:L-cysteine/cystine lyase
LHRDARRFEVATSCLPLCSGLSASLDLLAAQGSPAQRWQRIRAGAAQLWQGLQGLPGLRTLLPEPPPAGLVSFTGPAPSAAAHADVVRQLGAQAIWIRQLDAPDCLRACTHITTTETEITVLLEALAQLP